MTLCDEHGVTLIRSVPLLLNGQEKQACSKKQYYSSVMNSIPQFMVQRQQLLVLKLWFVWVVPGVMENQWEEERWKGREEA